MASDACRHKCTEGLYKPYPMRTMRDRSMTCSISVIISGQYQAPAQLHCMRQLLFPPHFGLRSKHVLREEPEVSQR